MHAQLLGGSTPPAASPIAIMAGDASTTGRLIVLPAGMPGFPGATQFELTPVESSGGWLWRLRSLTVEGLGFLLLANPCELSLIEQACGATGLAREDVIVLLVATVHKVPEGLRAYVNRRAPLVVDARSATAAQTVLSRPDYAVRHPLAH